MALRVVSSNEYEKKGVMTHWLSLKVGSKRVYIHWAYCLSGYTVAVATIVFSGAHVMFIPGQLLFEGDYYSS